MDSPDVNVLLSAASSESRHHDEARAALQRSRASVGGLGLLSQVAASFIRLATDPRVSPSPLTTREAVGFVDAVIDAPRARIIEPGPRHWGIFTDLCTSFVARRGDVTDCWLAAALLERDGVWVSFDRGFARFPGLRWIDPSEGLRP